MREQTQRTAHVGREHVVQELRSRGFEADFYGSKIPHVTASLSGRNIRIPVKTKRSSSRVWQDNINTLGTLESQLRPLDFAVYVALQPQGQQPLYYIWQLSETVRRTIRFNEASLAEYGGTRPVNPDSPNIGIFPDVFELGLNR